MNDFTNEPWECPRCGRMNAPFNSYCECKKEDKSYLEKALSNPNNQMQYPASAYFGYKSDYANYLRKKLNE